MFDIIMSNKNTTIMTFYHSRDSAVYSDDVMAGRPPISPPSESGARLAALRKAAGLSQAELGEALGIPARSVSFYERKAQSLPSHLLPKIAEALNVSIEAVVGTNSGGSNGKRGPKSDLELRFEQISRLPRRQQKKIIDVVDALLLKQQAG